MKQFLHKLFGDRGEREAAKFLRKLGYRILDRQHRDRFGEIDLIALDGRQIVFVEVKTRRSADAGQPFEAVDANKQRKIAQAALAWLKAKRRLSQSVRFDVISIIWPDDTKTPQIDHFRHAFDAPGVGQFFG